MEKNSIIIRLVLASLMIISGAVIYIGFRQDIIFVGLLPSIIVHEVRISVVEWFPNPGYFFVYSLPDGLWYGALLVYQNAFPRKTLSNKIILKISIVLPYVWEILQLHKDIPGTFDPNDLMVYGVVSVIFIIISYNN